jgi:hypothetical protein
MIIHQRFVQILVVVNMGMLLMGKLGTAIVDFRILVGSVWALFYFILFFFFFYFGLIAKMQNISY